METHSYRPTLREVVPARYSIFGGGLKAIRLEMHLREMKYRMERLPVPLESLENCDREMMIIEFPCCNEV